MGRDHLGPCSGESWAHVGERRPDPRDTRIAELEAENAELRATVERVRELAPDGLAVLDKISSLLPLEAYLGKGDYEVIDRLYEALTALAPDDQKGGE